MKKAMLLICGVIFFVGCASRTYTTSIDECKPKWYKNKEFSKGDDIIYGYSVEQSFDASTASGLGLGSAQIEALKQVNTRLKQEIKKGVDQKAKKIANESASELTNALYNRLAVSIDEPCPFCKIVEQSECQNNSGEIVVYTKVELKTENYLNRDLRNRLDTLLEDSDKLLEELKEF